MKLRLFGSYGCENCMMFKRVLTLMNIPFDFIDALAEETQHFCDLNAVNDLPHFQILDDNGRVEWQAVGNVTLSDLLLELKYNNAT